MICENLCEINVEGEGSLYIIEHKLEARGLYLFVTQNTFVYSKMLCQQLSKPAILI